jgi:hypothetical protein
MIILLVAIPCIYMGCGLKSKGEIIVEKCPYGNFTKVKIENKSEDEYLIFTVKKKNTGETYVTSLYPGEIKSISSDCSNDEYEIVGALKKSNSN